MMNQVFIINGSGGVGKDEFVNFVDDVLFEHDIKVANYSSVSRVKEIARMIGWNGEKTERDRKFLSDLKLLTTEYNDMPLNDMREYVEQFFASFALFNSVIFLHIREPEEIAKAVKIFNAKTILVKRDAVEHITSNMADENVFNYDYDYVIDNSGSLEDLKEAAKFFALEFLNGNLVPQVIS